MDRRATLGEWTFAAATYDGAEMRLYLNGVLVASQAFSESIDYGGTGGTFYVGGSFPGHQWLGGIDEVSVFDRAISDAEIAALYGAAQGTPGSQTVGIDLVSVSTSAVTPIASGQTDDGSYGWIVPASVAAGDYTIRVTVRTGASDESEPFRIGPAATEYYLNDATVAAGDYATAPGNDANDGRSPGAPMASLAALLAAYDLGAGDIVYIDGGTYALDSAIRLRAGDAGVTLQGSVVGTTLFARSNPSEGTAVFDLLGADGVALRDLHVTGADVGIRIASSADVEVTGSTIYENNTVGVDADEFSARTRVIGSEFYGDRDDASRDQLVGIRVFGESAEVSGNLVYKIGVANLDQFGGEDRGIDVSSDGGLVEGNEAYNHNIGFFIRNDGMVVAANNSHDNRTGYNIYNGTLFTDRLTQVSGNEARDNLGVGFQLEGYLEAYGNVASENDVGFAIGNNLLTHNNTWVGVLDARGGNISHSNRIGVDARSSFVHNNVVYNNSEIGISLTNRNLAAHGNTVYSNAIGIYANSILGYSLQNNLVYDNSNIGIQAVGAGNATRPIFNNTIWHDTGAAVELSGGGRSVELSNNIIVIAAGNAIVMADAPHADFLSDYNLIHTRTAAANYADWNGTAAADLAAWQAVSGQGEHDLEGDPLFIDIDGADNFLGFDPALGGRDRGGDDNFTLSAGSPAIDSGRTYDVPDQDKDDLARHDDPGTANSGEPIYGEFAGATSIFDSPLGGTALNLKSDDGSAEVALGFDFPFYDAIYDSVFVGVNGLLQFTNNTSIGDRTNTEDELIARARIAPLWDDLRTNTVAEDDVFVTPFAGGITIRWDATVKAGDADAQFAVTLFDDGTIRFDYAAAGNDGLTPTIGISRGSGEDYLLASIDGAASLAGQTSVEFRRIGGFYDRGAFEFGGSSNDTTAPQILSVTPEAAGAGGVIAGEPVTEIVITVSEPLITIDGNAASNYELREAGGNELFGDGDDVIIDLDPLYLPGGDTITLQLPGGALDPGNYRLTISGADGIRDLSGLALDGDGNSVPGGAFVSEFSIEAGVAGRHIFYNNSAFDGAGDSGAIAADKQVLLPGQSATFANYTSYSRGINGIMVDIANPAGALTAADFAFTTGNHDFVEGWSAAPAPLAVTVLAGQGVGGSDRVVITFADGAIVNQWLRVRVIANETTGLPEDDIFYVGNAIGDTGDSPDNAFVDAADTAATLANGSGFLDLPDITDAHDFNRDGLVNSIDYAIARDHAAGPADSLRLLNAPADDGDIRVVARQIFYNNSGFDGNDPAANAADAGAIAPDKWALLPGQEASFLNYTSYSRGINGIMVDIGNLAGSPGVADFAFAAGNDDDPGSWLAAPSPVAVSVSAGAGVGGSDRVTLIWADGAILGQWLQIRVLATAATGLASDDLFYFGNAPGETGNSASDAIVDAIDSTAVLANPRGTLNPADRFDAHDFDRDGNVNATDFAIARDHATDAGTALILLDAPSLPGPLMGFAPGDGGGFNLFDDDDDESQD
ncbi:MAG: LamG-like jellyroll fold domain-containing protein [Verrucomicrobiales bacterium]